MKRPELFTYIVHHVPVGPGYVHRGLVSQILSMQFSYETENGGNLCLFSEDWSVPKRSEGKQFNVTAPAVWRTLSSRTCIVLKVKDEEVSFIAMTVDEPFNVQTVDMKTFTTWYPEPIEYPVERAARLFVEYARNNGATDEVLEALKPHTEITKEEMEMARKKAADKANKVTEPKGKKDKKPSAKKAVDKKPRVSAANLYRENIMAGKSSAQIVAAVNRQIPGKGREDYVRWYYNDLIKKGESPPEPNGMAATKKGK